MSDSVVSPSTEAPAAPAAPGAAETASVQAQAPITRAVLVRRAVWAGVLAAILAAFVVWGPAICPVRNSVGVPCPGCGLTRATVALLHGDVAGALHYHPVVWLMLPIFLLMVVEEVYIFVRRERLTLLSRIPNVVWWPTGLIILVVWISRFFGAFGGPVDPPAFSASWLGMLIHWLAG